jgi:hypothetical protein
MINILSRIRRTGCLSEPLPAPDPSESDPTAIQHKLHAVFGRALCIRHVDAGSCNGCELEIHALSNPYYNLEGAGIRFVASPRHADLLLVTGPVSVNMEEALKRTYEAMPEPKWVLAPSARSFPSMPSSTVARPAHWPFCADCCTSRDISHQRMASVKLR